MSRLNSSLALHRQVYMVSAPMIQLLACALGCAATLSPLTPPSPSRHPRNATGARQQASPLRSMTACLRNTLVFDELRDYDMTMVLALC
ncbi:hypothetical protein M433DRAFT_508886 [Acidomyces richmondensis BFW]|nr:MAG: hypothetical protein FE78DRAFT_317266 [Acidomyces sp. 'richmondensis']KYG47241.1 hypothetical protein M433DRAFT_508886 [Acidomyces richmondensis BFW]